MGSALSRRRAFTVVIALLVVAASAIAYRGVARADTKVACPSEPRALLFVDTTNHLLATCEAGRTTKTFSVRLGRNGTGKERQGDRKTPLGAYGLGAPRASVAYGTFVPVEYPTPEQRRAGLTGSAIGVHGPDRKLRWAGALVNLFDTTDGCIGIATDDEMGQIAAWVRAKQVQTIVVK